MGLRLGQTLGPIIMGFGFALSGIAGVYIAGAVFALLMFVLILVMIR